MQKKYSTTLIMLLILVLLLTGCGTATEPEAAVDTGTSNSSSPGIINTDYENAMDVPSQLGLGTLELDGTENAITTDQAKTLLPLWKAVESLASSETITEAEMNGLYDQIAESLTPAQINAITAMELTQQDFMVFAQENNLFPEGAGLNADRFANLDPEAQATIQAARESGERPGGGAGSGIGGGPGGGAGRPGGGEGGEFVAPPEGFTGGAGRRLGVSGANPFLITAVIEYLTTLNQ